MTWRLDGPTICATVAAIFAAGGCFRATDLSEAVVRRSPESEGPLVARVEFPEAGYRVGDEIVAICSLTNVSDRPVTIHKPDFRRYIDLEAFRFILIRPDGVETDTPHPRLICATGLLGNPARKIVTLRPGESYSWRHQVYSRYVENGVLWNETGYDVSAPGVYAARFQCTSPGGPYSIRANAY